ncbi:hypothetical protein DYB37_000108 [Aphanomyces astaci]|uniref:FYVE-type domain-containing protein n=1 Tax=Aphanomyces astaci TaxID=112090 RepID=A0A3R6XS64_APHAT|nr:hypothetical protein DYB35_002041 [Aphanomyces astaci]RHZ21468.1 hypothetical protein DYB37_000108 [Aphanomyces astaci]
MTSAQPPSAKSWQYASTCYICRRPFGLLFSRHHCRNCGYSVCGAHSKYKAELVHLQGPQRVCNSCHRVLLASKPSPQQKSFVKRKVPSRRLLTRSMRLHPWEVAREPKKRFQWDRDLSLDPVASLKQRRRAPTEITTINSSGDMDLAGLTSLMALSKQKQTLQEDIQHLHAQLAQCKADTKRMHRRKVRTRRHIVSAMAYVTEGEYFLAQLDLKRALALNDRCIMTWHVLAECLLRCHWPDEAALACSVGLELVRAPGTVALLGRIRLAQRRLDDAIACFNEALK